MNWFAWFVLAGWGAVVAVARIARGRTFAIFVGVLMGVYSLVVVALAAELGAMRGALEVMAALQAATVVNFAALSRPRMRSLPYRVMVSWPASFFVAGSLLALPWAVGIAMGFHPWGVWVPYALAAVGMVQSLTTRRGEIDLVIGEAATAAIRRSPNGGHREERPLRIVQISDPHLGPFMSVGRLRRIAERAVAAEPDLVLLTGDFLTMESHGDPALLRDALAPLGALRGKVFACHGNHDHEAPEHVASALAACGAELLVDASREIETAAGPVQIVGMDFVWRDRQAHLARVCREHPRKPGVTRIVLLHDPGAFKHLPAGEGDLVLAGHTHGGQVGLLSLGLTWTFLSPFADRMPDHGFWARGTDRMYVHRGTGHYGFPLRLGVPAEESLLRVHRAPATALTAAAG